MTRGVSGCFGPGSQLCCGALHTLLNYSAWAHISCCSFHPQVKPPGIGAETTLVLTDVEGSTTLFEDLPQVGLYVSRHTVIGLARSGCMVYRGFS
jgi:hypothetical protein